MAAKERWHPRFRHQRINFLLVVIINVLGCTSSQYDLQECPGYYPKIFDESMPVAGTQAGNYVEQSKDEVKNIYDCIGMCCQQRDCNVILFMSGEGGDRCFLVSENSI